MSTFKCCREPEKFCVIKCSLVGAGICLLQYFIPFAIYADNMMIGFIMLGYYEAQNCYTIWKLMIDTKYQNQGYGKIALKLGIDYLVERFNVKEVYTAYESNNSVARKLYTSIGFCKTGEVDGNDIGMRLVVNNT